jgi:serine/threonine protein kinase
MVEFDNPRFNNKVDIWAMGCILYELVLKGKAFSGDGAVLLYSNQYKWGSGKKFEIPLRIETLPDENRRTFISGVILEALEVEPDKRPSAQELYGKFTGRGLSASEQTTPPPPPPSSSAPPEAVEVAMHENQADVEGSISQIEEGIVFIHWIAS